MQQNQALPPLTAKWGLLRAAVITPALQVADIPFNVNQIITAIAEVAKEGAQLALFPELCLTGYSCADLFYQTLLQEQARQGLHQVATATAQYNVVAIVGLPLVVNNRLYNCAAMLADGQVLGIVPKIYLPATHEFYEPRWFTSGANLSPTTIMLNGTSVPMGTDLLFQATNCPQCVIGIEICEDLWGVHPPSGDLALAGATLLLNLSASPEILGKMAYRRQLVQQQSARCIAAYLYAGAGPGESTTDVVYSGHSMITENGLLLAETARFQFDTQIAYADIDIQRLTHDRLQHSSFMANASPQAYRSVSFDMPATSVTWATSKIKRLDLSPTPFVPADLIQRGQRCQEIFNIQATGLARRLHHTGLTQVTLGLSGGLDSTLALLVTRQAFEKLNLDLRGIIAITMPGFGTTRRTKNNAESLAQELGVTLRTISIEAAVRQHFRDVAHDETRHDVTYENAQARERTQILMDVANQVGGLTVGTGDLSELALGWCTYNGDHMSMYHVNAGIPKTLVRYLIEWCADEVFEGNVPAILRDICATPITPELLPAANGEILLQETELTIGPYRLHDFFLFYAIRYGFSPDKIFYLAQQAFAEVYQPETIRHWLRLFYKRFVSQQFKRSAMPDGPKVGSVALSPRGDWRMPSDASNTIWLNSLDVISEINEDGCNKHPARKEAALLVHQAALQ